MSNLPGTPVLAYCGGGSVRRYATEVVTTPLVYKTYSFAPADIDPAEVVQFQSKFWNASRRFVEQRAYMRHGQDGYVIIRRTQVAHRNGDHWMKMEVVDNELF